MFFISFWFLEDERDAEKMSIEKREEERERRREEERDDYYSSWLKLSAFVGYDFVFSRLHIFL